VDIAPCETVALMVKTFRCITLLSTKECLRYICIYFCCTSSSVASKQFFIIIHVLRFFMFITIVRTAPSLSQSKSAIERGSSVHKKNAKSQRETQRSTETHEPKLDTINRTLGWLMIICGLESYLHHKAKQYQAQEMFQYHAMCFLQNIF